MSEREKVWVKQFFVLVVHMLGEYAIAGLLFVPDESDFGAT